MYLKKALRGTLLALVFTVLAGISWYLFRFMLARNLSLYEYGLFYAILAFLSFLNLFVDAGFSQAVPKFIIEFKEKKDEKNLKKILLTSLSFQVLITLLLFLGVFLLSNFLSSHYFHTDVSKYLLLMGIWFITVPFSYFFAYMFSGFQKYGLASSLDFVRVMFTLSITFILFRLGMGFYSPIYAYAATNILLTLFYFPFSLKIIKFSKYKSGFDSSLFLSLLKFGVFVSFSSIIWVILSQIDTLILTFFSGVEAVGLYQSAVPLASVALYFITAITLVSYPISAELFAKKKMKELSEGINLFYKYILLILVPALMILFSFSSSILYVLFGEQFTSASLALKILSIGAMFSAITLFNNNMLSALGRPKIVAKTMLFVAITNVVLCISLIPLFGINGAAVSTAIAFLIGSIVSLIKLNQIIKTKVPIFDWLKTILAGILMVVFIVFTKAYLNINNITGFIILGCVGLLLYLAICFLFRIINLKEIKSYTKLVLK